MDVDYFGQIALTKALLPSMLRRREGHIIVTSSVAGYIGVPLRSAYCAAKHALHGFFDTLRTEVCEENIKITLICPSYVKTGISKAALTGKGKTFGHMTDVIAGGVSPRDCAMQMIHAVVKGKEEMVIGKGAGKYAVYVKRYFPAVYSRLVRNSRAI